MVNYEAAITGGVVSLVVTASGVLLSNYLTKQRLEERDLENWADEMISKIRRLRRNAMQLDPSDELEISEGGKIQIKESDAHLQNIRDIVLEIGRKHDGIPSDYRETRIDASITNLLLVMEAQERISGEFSMIDLRKELQLKSEEALDDLADELGIEGSLY